MADDSNPFERLVPQKEAASPFEHLVPQKEEKEAQSAQGKPSLFERAKSAVGGYLKDTGQQAWQATKERVRTGLHEINPFTPEKEQRNLHPAPWYDIGAHLEAENAAEFLRGITTLGTSPFAAAGVLGSRALGGMVPPEKVETALMAARPSWAPGRIPKPEVHDIPFESEVMPREPGRGGPDKTLPAVETPKVPTAGIEPPAPPTEAEKPPKAIETLGIDKFMRAKQGQFSSFAPDLEETRRILNDRTRKMWSRYSDERLHELLSESQARFDDYYKISPSDFQKKWGMNRDTSSMIDAPQIDRITEELAAREKEGNPFNELVPEGGGSLGAARSPTQAGPSVPQTPQANVNRFTMRRFENIFDRLQGAHEAVRTEAVRELNAKPDMVGSPKSESAFRFGENDPQAGPIDREFWDKEVQPIRAKNYQLWDEISAMQEGRAPDPDIQEALEDMNPGYMHRVTIDRAKRKLGLSEEDPISGYRKGGPGLSVAGATKPRNYFAIEDAQGNRRVIYKNNGDIFLVSHGKMDKLSLPDDFEFAVGSNLPLKDFTIGGAMGPKGRAAARGPINTVIKDAFTREITEAGGPEYVADAVVSTRVANIELTQMRDSLLARQEALMFLDKQGLVSREPKPGFAPTEYPGFHDLYVHDRLRAVLDRFAPKLAPVEPVWDRINRGVHYLVTSMFWNPIFHGWNVANHAIIERGWRNFNPVENLRYIGRFRQAWRDVAEMNDAYLNNLREGARMMYGPRQARLDLNERLFGYLEFVKNPQNIWEIQKFEDLGNFPPGSFIKSIYRWSGDALWQIGDVLTQAAIYDRQAHHPNESLRESIMRVHREIPSYRIPTEEIFPGQVGRDISTLLRDPKTNALVLFTRYHENIDRGLVMIGEDIMGGEHGLKSAEGREGAAEALGKVAAIAIGLEVLYNYVLDPVAHKINKDLIAKRGGPMSIIQAWQDWLIGGKHLSQGAKTRTLTGGFYSPSPLVEIPANAFGYHAYSMSPIQPRDTKKEKLRFFGGQVPAKDRIEEMAGSALQPITQTENVIAEPWQAIPNALGLTQYSRKTTEQLKEQAKERKEERKKQRKLEGADKPRSHHKKAPQYTVDDLVRAGMSRRDAARAMEWLQ